jgi:hypothetical protein
MSDLTEQANLHARFVLPSELGHGDPVGYLRAVQASVARHVPAPRRWSAVRHRSPADATDSVLLIRCWTR